MSNRTIIKPQPGFQEAFLSSRADIGIGGGAAGAGKTYAMLMDPLRFAGHKGFTALYFRRSYPEITNPGGLMDTASTLYPLFGARPVDMDWRFPSGASVVFRHLQHEKTKETYQGSQIPLIYFDELTHFTESQFWYMPSRNRNPLSNGIKSYIRASCNPDPDSFVANMIEWWIDQEEKLEDGSPNPRYGFPIPERAGLLRYFTRDKSEFVWGDSPQEVIDKAPYLFTGELADVKPKSLTFIPGDIYGNKALLSNDPAYLSNLMALGEQEQARLLRGNWKVRSDGMALYDSAAVGSIFTNYAPASSIKCITGDIARFGHDWTVFFVWHGWEVVGCLIMKVNDSPEAVKAVEFLREKFGIMAHNVLIDQNGVGGEVLSLRPDYQGFLNNAQPMDDPQTRVKENYKNLKAQCYYRSAINRVNPGAIKFTLNEDNVWIYESSPTAGGYNHVIQRSCKTKMGGKVVDIRDVIKQQLRAIRKAEKDPEGKQQINSKEAQKVLLGGWSPDFADCVMMREYFELVPQRLRFRGPVNS